MAGPLEGIKVLDLSWVLSGPYCTMVLSDLGAEVIKVERPEIGDVARGTGPLIDGLSSYFLSLNRGKKSVTLDFATEKGREILLRLVSEVDVLVENFVPGTMKKRGLDYKVLKRHNPKLVYCAISGFGQTGPDSVRSSLDIVAQARGGVMSITGEPGGPPLRPGVSLGDIAAGLFASIGILAALQERNQSGKGQMVDISMLDSIVALEENAFARYFATGDVPRSLGTRHPVMTPFQAFETKDGYGVVGIVGHQWPLFCATIDHIELVDDPRFETGWLRTQNYDQLIPVLNEAMKTKTTQEWDKAFTEVEIPWASVNNIGQVCVDPQIVARNMVVEVVDKRKGKLKVINTPVKTSRTKPRVERAAPELGEHTEEILSSLLGLSQDEISELRESRAV